MLIKRRSGLQIFSPFVQLPSRSLRDYYQLIKEPVSLSAVQKRVRGIIGRGPPTGITELKSWDAFANMTSLIWKNARDYNEDGSELYNVSIELEVCQPRTSLMQHHLIEAGNVQETAARSKGKCCRTTATKAQAQHVDRCSCNAHSSRGPQTTTEAQVATKSRIGSEHYSSTKLCYTRIHRRQRSTATSTTPRDGKHERHAFISAIACWKASYTDSLEPFQWIKSSRFHCVSTASGTGKNGGITTCSKWNQARCRIPGFECHQTW